MSGRPLNTTVLYQGRGSSPKLLTNRRGSLCGSSAKPVGEAVLRQVRKCVI